MRRRRRARRLRSARPRDVRERAARSRRQPPRGRRRASAGDAPARRAAAGARRRDGRASRRHSGTSGPTSSVTRSLFGVAQRARRPRASSPAAAPGSRSRHCAISASSAGDIAARVAGRGAGSNSCGQRPSAKPSNGSVPVDRLEQHRRRAPTRRRDGAISPAGELLGRHVRGRADPRAGRRRRVARRAACAMPKSTIFGSPSPREHDVAGLEIAMDDAALVRGRMPSAIAAPSRRTLGLVEPAARCEPRRERLAVEPLHDEVERPSSSRPKSSTRTTLRMRDRARARRLGDEARDRAVVGGELRAQHLDRDRRRRSRVARPRTPRSCRRAPSSAPST